MAAQRIETKNSTELKYEDVVNSKEEATKIKELIDIAFQEGNEQFVHFGDGNSFTVRSDVRMMDDVTKMDVFYESAKSGFEDNWSDQREADIHKIITELKMVKCIDDNHEIGYQSIKSLVFGLVAARDFNFMTTRFKYENYANNQKIVGNVLYSIPEDHPFYVPTKKKHVRCAHFAMGLILSVNNDDIKNNQVRVCEVLTMDLGGSFPKWILKKIAPFLVVRAKRLVEKKLDPEETLKKREKNNFKKDYEPLFTN